MPGLAYRDADHADEDPGALRRRRRWSAARIDEQDDDQRQRIVEARQLASVVSIVRALASGSPARPTAITARQPPPGRGSIRPSTERSARAGVTSTSPIRASTARASPGASMHASAPGSRVQLSDAEGAGASACACGAAIAITSATPGRIMAVLGR
ncbi:MAG: hypothetical protein WKG01_23425 [Kofleriaceae bacterium]